MKSNFKLLSLGVITAVAASLCCIAPILVLFAGMGSVVSSLEWLNPLRPYLIGVCVITLGVAWFQFFTRKKEVDCECEGGVKSGFLRSQFFLISVTVLSGVMLALPSFSSSFYTAVQHETGDSGVDSIAKVEFNIKGMTCESCESPIYHQINKLPGIRRAEVSYNNGNAVVEYNLSSTSPEEIEASINSTGYHVTKVILNEHEH